MSSQQKILLGILPYWDPLIPPNGIAYLKSYLNKFNIESKCVDFIIKEKSQILYKAYFENLKKFIPEKNWGNFFNLGHDVLHLNMMAHINYTNIDDYYELLADIIDKIFRTKLSRSKLQIFIGILGELFDYLKKEVLELIGQENYNIVGFTAYRGNIASTLYILKAIKKEYPMVKTLIGGGIFLDTCAEQTKNFNIFFEYSKTFIDKIFIGQGELLLLKYLRNELPGTKKIYTIRDIQNTIVQFNELNIPDYTDFELERYPYMPATASISCINSCSFCGAINFWGKYRKKDVKQTVSEMFDLHKKYEYQLFFMTDQLLNPVISDMAHEIIQKGYSLYYDTYFRIDDASCNVQNTLEWRKGGLYRVRLGVESGSQRMLDIMNKNIKIDQIKNAIWSLAYAGIKTTTYWISGHPGETDEDFEQTLKLIEELKDSIYQAEDTVFKYHAALESKKDIWTKHQVKLFPNKYDEMLLFEYYTLDVYPTNTMAFERSFKFQEHCRKHGIPLPYSIDEYIKADDRWKSLHKNAVPPLHQFLIRDEYIEENKQIENQVLTESSRTQEVGFIF